MQERRRYGTLFFSFEFFGSLFLPSIRHYLPMENVKSSYNRSLGKSAINTQIASQKDADKEPTLKEPYNAESRNHYNDLSSH